MNEDQFNKFMTKFTEMCEVMTAGSSTSKNISHTSLANIPCPKPLEVDEGDISDNFKIFKDNWEVYCKATGMSKWSPQEEERKVNILLSLIGDAAKKKYGEFGLTEQETKDTASLLKALESKLVSKRNLIYDRYIFHNCNQMQEESFEDYYARLKKAVDVCSYDNAENVTKDLLLRDRIAFGVSDMNLRRSFLQADPEKLSLDKIVQECKAFELTSQQLKKLSKDSEVNVKKIDKEKQTRKLCKFCGREHKFIKGECPAIGATCNKCQKKNHFAAVCGQNRKSKKKKPKRKVKEIDRESTSSETDSSESTDSGNNIQKVRVVSKIVDNSGKGGSVGAVLKLRIGCQWKRIQCDIDTGSSVCLIGFDFLCNLLGTKTPALSRSSFKLKDFGGNEIKTRGEKILRCKRRGEKYDIVFQVVEKDHGPLLSANASKVLGLVKFCNEIKGAKIFQNDKNLKIHVQKANKIVEKYEKLFDGYGCLKGEVHLEVDPDVTPHIQAPRRIPVSYTEGLKTQLDQMVKDEIIFKESDHTEWVSNILIVKQKGKLRVCLDPIPLNEALKRPNFQFTTLDEILPELDGARIFSTVDLKKGFWHVKLGKKSSKLTTFWTPFGRFRWLRMPFGINSAPEIFAMKMKQIIQGLNGVEILADDILIYGRGATYEEAFEDHNRNLENLFKRLLENNCRLNREKLNLCSDSVLFYGHVLSKDGVQPDPIKTFAIKNMPIPKNKKDLSRFLGMVTYLGRYIPNLTKKLSTLRNIAKENTDWVWTDKEQKEFDAIKEAMCKAKPQKFLNKNHPITIETDASNEGLGAVLYQDNQVIAFASRTLKGAEKNYAPIEKETLAIVFACNRFDQFILGSEVTIKTDHHPLIAIFKKPLLKVPKRLQQMRLALQRYSPKIVYIKGKENVVADGLSRAPVDIDFANFQDIDRREFESVLKIEKEKIRELRKVHLIEDSELAIDLIRELKAESSQDAEIRLISTFIVNGWPEYVKEVPEEIRVFFKFKNELSIYQGLILRNDRILVPRKLRRVMVKKLHAAHSGINFTLNLARDNVFWPGMSDQIRETVSQCQKCAKFASSQQKFTMKSSQIPEYAFQFVSLDIFFWDSKGKQRKFLVTSDHYSDFFEVDELKDLTSKSVIDACIKNFSRHGVPEEILTDNGSNLVSKEVRKFANRWNIRISTSAPHHQQSNGKAEATVKVAKNLLKKSSCDEEFWYALLVYRNTPNSKGSSPVQRLYSRRTRSGIPTLRNKLKPEIVHNVPIKIKEQKEKSKFYYDKNARKQKPLDIGQPVYVQLNPEKTTTWTPGEVHDKQSDRSYTIEVNGNLYRRDAVHTKNRNIVSPEPETSSDRHQPVEASVTVEDQSREDTTRGDQGREDIESNETTSHQPVLQRPKRNTRKPERFKDFVMS